MGTTDQLIGRLSEIAARLREPDLDAEESESLAREAADLVAKASAAIEAALRQTREGEGA
jgi:hypothetical protein